MRVCDRLLCRPAAQEVEPHRLKVARQPGHQQTLPRIVRVHLHCRALRPAQAQSITNRGKGLRQCGNIALLRRGQRGQPNGTIELRHLHQPFGNFARCAIVHQPRAKAFGMMPDIGRKQRAERRRQFLHNGRVNRGCLSDVPGLIGITDNIGHLRAGFNSSLAEQHQAS